MITNQFLTKNNMADMRNLSACEIVALESGCYSCVELLGYYEKGDTPNPIKYYISTTSEVDNGGSVIEVGAFKLEHKFTGAADVKYFGAVPFTDATEEIQICLNKCSNPVISDKYLINGDGYRLPDSSFEYGGLKLSNNQILTFTENGQLQKITTSTDIYSIINITDVVNVTVINANLVGDVETHTGTAGEWGHGIVIQSADNITIENATVNDFWGDGISIGTGWLPNALPSSNVTIQRCKAYYNRRQGISVMGAIRYNISDCDLSYTGQKKFVAPGYGIDIEPNQVNDERIDGVITNLKTSYNYGGGLLIVPAYLQDKRHEQSHRVMKVIVDGWYSDCDNYNSDNYIRGAFRLSGASFTLPNIDQSLKVDGFICLSNIVINRAWFVGAQIVRFNDMGLRLIVNDMTIQNANDSGQTGIVSGSGLSFQNTQDLQLSYAHMEFNNLNIFDNRSVPKMFLPIHFETLMAIPFENVTLNNVNFNRYSSTYMDIGHWLFASRTTESIRTTTYKKFLDTSFLNIELKGYRDYDFYVTQRKLVTLPPVNMKGYSITIYNATLNNEVFVTCPADSTISYKDFDGTRAIAVPLGGKVKFTLKDDGIWYLSDIVGQTYFQGQRLQGTTAQRPTANMKSTDIGFVYIDTTIGRKIEWSGTGWVDTKEPASVAAKGLVNQAAFSADSANTPGVGYSQSEVMGILTELRDLKVKLRTAGILAN